MKKILISLLLLVTISYSVYYFIQNKYNTDVSFVTRQIVFNGSEKASQLTPSGEKVDFLEIDPDYEITIFANLNEEGSPRVISFDPNGVMYVTLPKAGKVLALPDINKDGVADRTKTVLTRLHNPHGIEFDGSIFLVAEETKVVEYSYDSKELVASPSRTLFTLPNGGRHTTRTIKVNDNKIYTSVGSSCDVCFEDNEFLGTMLVSERDGSDLGIFASGLRNTVFFDIDSQGRIWGSDMGRDFLGNSTPPDELNLIEEGKDYGWPICYGENIHDTSFDKKSYQVEDNSVCDSLGKMPSFYNYPAHVAPLGTTVIDSPLFSSLGEGNILVSFHGSWNSTVPVGYKIVLIEMENGSATDIRDFITGWLGENNQVLGRPVDIAFSPSGEMYISDDKANLIYLVSKK